MKIVLAGGSGFIGSKLIKILLDENNQVVLLSRKADTVGFKCSDLLQIVKWDGKNSGPWMEHINSSDAVINLSGENVSSKRWTEKRKVKLIQSRLEPTRAIIDSISLASVKPKILINASAAGYYGNDSNEDVSESHPKGSGYLADLCEQWEAEAMVAEKFGIRVVLLRIGIVLEKSGGALKKMSLPFKFFLGGPLGSGEQWFPWIHRDDVIRIIKFTLDHNSIKGAVNVASPFPVTMKKFASLLGKTMKRPSAISVPSFVLKIMLGEMSEMLLGGIKIIPKKLIDSGFQFQYPELNKALESIIK